MLLLPYIDQEELYQEFKFDEPWDSEHNIRLLERMPTTYAPPGHKKSLYPAHHTICHVFVGPGTAFEGPGGLALKDFPDGMSSTLLIVEAGEAVPWTKPADIPFDPARVVVPRGPFRDGFRACMGDGSRRFIRYDMSGSRLRGAVVRNDGVSEYLD